MQTQRHFVVQVEDVVRIERSKGTFCEDFQLDAFQLTNLGHIATRLAQTNINDVQPSQGNQPARIKACMDKEYTHKLL